MNLYQDFTRDTQYNVFMFMQITRLLTYPNMWVGCHVLAIVLPQATY